MGESKNIDSCVPNADFSKNVFVNCPFDSEYFPFLRALMFTVLCLGYNPRIASERFNSAEQRIDKICGLVRISKFSIHDLSRARSTKSNEYYRMNMPFELGLDIGCRLFNGGTVPEKVCLVLEKKRYDYQKALSDLAGVDIKEHSGSPENLVTCVRNWFVENGLSRAPSSTVIWDDFNKFMADFYAKRKLEGFREKDLQVMPVPEFISFVKEWLTQTSGAQIPPRSA